MCVSRLGRTALSKGSKLASSLQIAPQRLQTGVKRMDTGMRETELYAPVKTWLEARGFEVKAEIGECDVMACRPDEDPVIVELKTGFSLTLFHQGIDRLKVTDAVYLAVPKGAGRAWHRSWRDNLALCRRLGLGLLTVRLKDGLVEVHADPGPYAPRKQSRRKGALLRTFARLEGDPNTGGQRGARVTAYRQDAERIRNYLAKHGPSKGADVAKETGVSQATRMMRDNHYGWFEPVERGVYQLQSTVLDGALS